MIKHFFNKLSIQISAIIILFGALGMTVFCFLYSYREDFFEFSQEMGIISENTEAYAINIENQLIDNNVSINDVDTIDSILGISEIYSVNLYNKADNLSITGSYATMLDNLLVGYTVYDTDAIYNGDVYHTDIELEDGTIETYRLVTTVRNNPLKGLISIESPIGKALAGHKCGDTVHVQVSSEYGYDVVVQSVKNTPDDDSIELRKF